MAGNPNYFKHAYQFHQQQQQQQQKKRKFEAGSSQYPPNSKSHHAHGGRVLTKMAPGYGQQQSHQELLRETRQLPIFFGKAALIQVSKNIQNYF